MESKLVIFGASIGGVKVANTLFNLNINFEFFVDNDEKKWGSIINGKNICSPRVLTEKVYNIIIASAYYEEIEKQLYEMGIKEENIIVKENLIIENYNEKLCTYFDKQKEEYEETISIGKENKKQSFIMDLAEGIDIGGIESWTYVITEELLRQEKNTVIFTKNTEIKPPQILKDNVLKLDILYEKYSESVENLITSMKKYLPFTLIANWMTHVFFAAYILKKLYPDKVSIIGMVHHDMVGLYKRNKALEPYIDMFICVSSDTRKKMIEKYRIEKDKVLYKEVPIPIVEGYVKEYSKDGEPLQINFASRLVKSKKRADLIIPLIKKLEKYNINYNLNIAGGGDYYDKIKEYIKKNDLKNKVKLYGSIKYEEMAEFWKKGDIVLSISDSEGMGLSILEGMSFGLVPIVTDTSGIWDFITPKINGFICEINNIDMIVESIKELDNDRNTVKVFGEASKNIIKRKCSVSEYVKWVCSIQNNEKHND